MIAFVNPTKGKPKRKAAAPKSGKKAKRRRNPATKKAASKGASMKKRRSAAQKAATAKMIRANKARRHHNPSSPKKHHYKAKRRKYANGGTHRRRRHRNPSFSGGGSILKEFLSKEGLIIVASGLAGATLPIMAQAKFLPQLTGYTKTAVRAGIGLAGAWLLAKWNRKAALWFGGTALIGAVAEAVNTWQANAIVQPVTAQQQGIADAFAENPVLMDSLTTSSPWKPLNDGWTPLADDGYGAHLTDGYAMALNDTAFSSPFTNN